MTTTLPTRIHQTSTPDITTLTPRINALIKKFHVPSLSIALINNRTITTQSFGLATLSPPKKATTETIYDIASCSKSLTAAAIALLVSDNDKYPQIQWTSKMADLLPEDFIMSKESHTQEITLIDILSHRTGLPSHDSSYLGTNSPSGPDTPKSVTRNLRNLPLTEGIREKFQYCNLMYTVSTHLLESITGQTFEEFLHEKFFKPLGMGETNLQPKAAIAAGLKERLAMPYRWIEEEGGDEEGKEGEKGRYRELAWQFMPQSQGAGHINTTVGDWAKYLRAVMLKEGPISKGVYSALMRPRICVADFDEDDDDDDEGTLPFTSPIFYALGWEVRWYRGFQIIQHDGGVPGFGSIVFFIPAYKFGGVIFGNGGEAAGIVGEILSKEIIDDVLSIPIDQRTDWEARYEREEREYQEGKGSMLKRLCPELEECLPLEREMGEYVGRYWNAGYHEMVVEIKDGKLFIDASDRSEGFYLTLEHVCDQKTFIGHLVDYYDGMKDELEVQFKIEGEKVVSLGVKDKETYDEYVWYERKSVG